MPVIISQQRFESERERFFSQYEFLLEKTEDAEEKKKWKKLGKNFERMKKCYSAKKVLTIKTLRFFEKYQLSFKEGQRAIIVRCIELLKKLLWHKKLNKID
ncbi:TPA: hypothetical protein EYG96_00590 [Candidatus Gracilibacteria bacterium]|nr:hypothetical protein [Candidatus Peregrinibacteria bacterium]HIQ56525.1 hypothetical protein [Candidatus Gracilibacteria bacterium]HIQ57300.1 hypothetical protein [Candidatus Gracilibacteria bacterium]